MPTAAGRPCRSGSRHHHRASDGARPEWRVQPPHLAPAAALLRTVREGLQSPAEELAAGEGERLQAVLDFAGRFHRYSLHHQALIAAQCPQATYVAGYRAWQRLGYQVRRGERGIRILAPRPSTVVGDDGTEEGRLGFAAVTVFDAGQLTEQPALPTLRTPLPDGQRARYAAVLAAVQAEGIVVEERDDLGSAEGYSAGGLIALRAGLDSRNRTLVLLHEWAHELLHNGEAQRLVRGRKEAQAEATAYVVARHCGLAHPFAAEYPQSWRVLTAADLERELGAVARAAGHIIDRLEAGGEEAAAGAGADAA